MDRACHSSPNASLLWAWWLQRLSLEPERTPTPTKSWEPHSSPQPLRSHPGSPEPSPPELSLQSPPSQPQPSRVQLSQVQEPERSSRLPSRHLPCAKSMSLFLLGPEPRHRQSPSPDRSLRWSSADSFRPCQCGRLSLHRCPPESCSAVWPRTFPATPLRSVPANSAC